jgi:hypothetical protein
MILRDVWDFRAKATFYALRMSEATAVARAVIAFAERGEGELTRQGAHWVLRAGVHVAVLAIDHEARTVTVLNIHRAFVR